MGVGEIGRQSRNETGIENEEMRGEAPPLIDFNQECVCVCVSKDRVHPVNNTWRMA